MNPFRASLRRPLRKQTITAVPEQPDSLSRTSPRLGTSRQLSGFAGGFDRSMQHHLMNVSFKDGVYDPRKMVETLHEIGRAYGKPDPTIRKVLLPRGGIPPIARRRSRLALTLAE